MDPKPLKSYHLHGMDSRDFLKCYFEENSGFKEESLVFIMEQLHIALAEANIKGQTLIDISLGSIIHQLYTVSDFFKEITILKLNDTCILELNKWLNTRTGAFSWGHASKIVTQLQGIRDQEEEKEENVKIAIKRIVKFDLNKENLTDPVVLPQADCLLTAWFLDAICHNQNDYIKNLRKMAKLIKPGGYFILIGCLNGTYYTAGKERLHMFTCDEMFIRKTLTDERFVILSCKVLKRKVESDLIDYKQLIVLTAVKGNV
ncbi:nicotinamide N-methyltransferase-like isoform X1 [Mixophyes fleayi]|uniref:nicotinamide N-methyltransferase-like isoform X1 n=1 Tax=Mixophyes fleayi TaxID=3061075 RepID=UPI003F4D9FFE